MHKLNKQYVETSYTPQTHLDKTIMHYKFAHMSSQDVIWAKCGPVGIAKIRIR